MAGMTFSEREAMAEIKTRLEAEGYEVVLEPGPNRLPRSLDGVRPDAVATGRDPRLLVEVAGGRGPRERERLIRMRQAVAALPDWELRVFYYPEQGADVAPLAGNVIEEVIDRVERLSSADPQAALLLAWSGLEAAARSHLPLDDPRALSPSMLIDALVSLGHVDQPGGQRLSEIAKLRNAIAHGQLDRHADPSEVRFLTDTIRSFGPEAHAA